MNPAFIAKATMWKSRTALCLLLLVVNGVRGAPPRNTLVEHNPLVKQGRKWLNFSGWLGSARTMSSSPSSSAYDRLMGHPVFQVTTAWGSSYLTMERLSGDSSAGSQSTSKLSQREALLAGKSTSTLKKERDYQTISVYFLDPEDAISYHADLQQMEQMEGADIRITATSLGKAMRQAANLGPGLVTGVVEMNKKTGRVPSTDEGGILRYKLMPPKRQLYYAAQCTGRERVGFWEEKDIFLPVEGNLALENKNLLRRRNKEGGSDEVEGGDIAQQYQHMQGHTGIPVFYAPGLQKKQFKLKQWIRGGSSTEIPLFFSYEDLQSAWKDLRKSKKNPSIPEAPSNVEVFNLWDVVTSIDKDQWRQNHSAATSNASWTAKVEHAISKHIGRPLLDRFRTSPPSIQDVVFVPPSSAVEFKDELTRRGNGKARLRPMR